MSTSQQVDGRFMPPYITNILNNYLHNYQHKHWNRNISYINEIMVYSNIERALLYLCNIFIFIFCHAMLLLIYFYMFSYKFHFRNCDRRRWYNARFRRNLIYGGETPISLLESDWIPTLHGSKIFSVWLITQTTFNLTWVFIVFECVWIFYWEYKLI
jgi:hypothetical protein